jgi:hypothetical protein
VVFYGYYGIDEMLRDIGQPYPLTILDLQLGHDIAVHVIYHRWQNPASFDIDILNAGGVFEVAGHYACSHAQAHQNKQY